MYHITLVNQCKEKEIGRDLIMKMHIEKESNDLETNICFEDYFDWSKNKTLQSHACN
jgi:hypothetical protein